MTWNDEDGMTFGDQLSEETPESAAHKGAIHRASRRFPLWPKLTAKSCFYIHAGYNARELARRLGKDPSGVTKRLKRAAQRLQENIEKNS